MDYRVPCRVEYLRFIYNIKINEEDDYNKNLVTCLESYYQIPMPDILEKLKNKKKNLILSYNDIFYKLFS